MRTFPDRFTVTDLITGKSEGATTWRAAVGKASRMGYLVEITENESGAVYDPLGNEKPTVK